SLAGELGVDFRPLLVDRGVFISGKIYLPSVDLASVKVNVHVGMFGIPVDRTEPNGLWKGLLEELVCQVTDLLVAGRNVEGEDDAIVGSSTLGLLKAFLGAEVRAQSGNLFLQPFAAIR